MIKSKNNTSVFRNKIGLEIIQETDKFIKMKYRNERIKFFKSSENYTGSTIEQGRGIDDLLDQINIL